LNAFHHLKKRLWWLHKVEEYLARDVPSDPGHRDYIRTVTARDAPLSSITRALLICRGLLMSPPER
jgi:hypothetical protein